MKNKFNLAMCFRRCNHGFTLIELIIFLGVLTTLILVLGRLFTSVIDSQLETKSYSGLEMDGRFILARLANDFQSADSADTANNYIDLPATGSAGPVLRISINSVLYTYRASTSGEFQLVTPVLNNLTSSDTRISDLTFQRLGPGDNRDSILINFRLTSRTQKYTGYEFREFQSAFAMP